MTLSGSLSPSPLALLPVHSLFHIFPHNQYLTAAMYVISAAASLPFYFAPQEIDMLKDGMGQLKMVQQKLMNSKLSVEVRCCS